MSTKTKTTDAIAAPEKKKTVTPPTRKLVQAAMVVPAKRKAPGAEAAATSESGDVDGGASESKKPAPTKATRGAMSIADQMKKALAALGSGDTGEGDVAVSPADSVDES